GAPDDSFVRFDLDNLLTGKTIDAVWLQLVVTSDASASSDHSGEVWKVSTFSVNDLNGGKLPGKMGVAPVGADLGPVSTGQTVQWTLPTTLVMPNSILCLGIYTSSANGAAYWNTGGPSPPVLIIKYH